MRWKEAKPAPTGMTIHGVITQDSDTNAIDMSYHNKAYNGLTTSYLACKAYKFLQWYYTIIFTPLTHI